MIDPTLTWCGLAALVSLLATGITAAARFSIQFTRLVDGQAALTAEVRELAEALRGHVLAIEERLQALELLAMQRPR